MSRKVSSSAPSASYTRAISTGSPASRRSTKFTPLTTRPASTSRHGMTRTAKLISPLRAPRCSRPRPSDRIGLDLDQHLRVDQRRHLRAGARRTGVAEALPVGATDLLPAGGDGDEYARADAVGEREAGPLEGFREDPQRFPGLRTRVAGVGHVAVDGRGGAADPGRVP